MRTEIRLTGAPKRVTATTTQPASEAIEALGFGSINLFLLVYEASGPSPSVTVTIETSMQNAADDAVLWDTIGTFAAISASNSSDVQSITSGILKYIRYKVTLGANTTGATFDLSGVAAAG